MVTGTISGQKSGGTLQSSIQSLTQEFAEWPQFYYSWSWGIARTSQDIQNNSILIYCTNPLFPPTPETLLSKPDNALKNLIILKEAFF